MIYDGYTLLGRVGGSVSLRFAYRPMLKAERSGLFESIRHFDSDDATWLTCEAMARHLFRWSREDFISDGALATLHEQEPELFERLFRILSGVEPPDNLRDQWSPDWEQRSLRNLRDGVELEILHPKTAALSCDACRAYEVDPIDGEFTLDRQTGKPIPRDPKFPVLCETDKNACPKGSHVNPKGLTEQNRRALEHYVTNQANGCHDDDPIVRRNAAAIGKVFDRIKRDGLVRQISQQVSQVMRRGR